MHPAWKGVFRKTSDLEKHLGRKDHEEHFGSGWTLVLGWLCFQGTVQ